MRYNRYPLQEMFDGGGSFGVSHSTTKVNDINPRDNYNSIKQIKELLDTMQKEIDDLKKRLDEKDNQKLLKVKD